VWESQFFGTSEFKVSEVSRERDRDTVGEKTRNKGEATRGRTGGFLSRFVGNNEEKYHFGISGLRRSEGGEDIEFKC
jgi:hypothetical protein